MTATIDVNFPVSRDGRHVFFQQLVTESMKVAGYTVNLQEIDVPRHRRSFLALEQGEIDLMYLLPSPERDQLFRRINQPLTRGLIGNRILLVPASALGRYQHIHSLKDFRDAKLVAGFGAGWADITIWRTNQLPFYVHQGDWTALYRLVASQQRGVDYFPRGASEILLEAAQYAELVIEPNLVLTYPSDFYFYVHPDRADLAEALDIALQKAMKNGVYEQLYKQHLAPIAQKLRLNDRRIIPLVLPDSN